MSFTFTWLLSYSEVLTYRITCRPDGSVVQLIA